MGEPRSTAILDMTGELPSDGLGELRPEELAWLPDTEGRYSSNPADRWNLESLFTTREEVWVLTPTGPPYGVMGKMWVVPRNVDTATHLESGLKAMS